MANATSQPQTFVAMVLTLLEHHFPWLGRDQPESGSDTADQSSDLHHRLRKARNVAQRKKKRPKP